MPKEMKAIYCGVFIDKDSARTLSEAQKVKLSKPIQNMHCTFVFRPSRADEIAFNNAIGTYTKLKVIAYGNSGENSGFMVEIPDNLKHLYKGCANPHITVSIADNGRAVNTGYIDFNAIEPFYVCGTLGIYYDTGIVKTSKNILKTT